MRRILAAILFTLGVTLAAPHAQMLQAITNDVHHSGGGGCAGGALALDGSVHKNITAGTSTTVSLTTSVACGTAYCAVLANIHSSFEGNVTAVSGSTLGALTKRAAVGDTTSGPNGLYAYAKAYTSALSSEVITITYENGGTTFSTIDCFGIANTKTTSQFDPNGTVPATAATFPSDPLAISTNNANDFILGTFRQNSAASPTAGTGWTAVSGANFLLTEYKIVSATQTLLAVTVGTGVGDTNGGIADAIEQGP